MTEALLCDIDGTLVQSNWLHAEAWQLAFREMDIELDVETLRKQIGKGGDELIPVFVPWWRRLVVEEPLKTLRSHIFRTEFLSRVEPIAGARDLLVRLKQHGIRAAIASSADAKDLAFYKHVLGIDDLVDAESTADDAKHSKPHPDIFSATLKRLGLPADKVMALGDTPWDAEAAGLAGISTIGVETGGWTQKELLDAGCVAVYRDVGELLACFDTSLLVR